MNKLFILVSILVCFACGTAFSEEENTSCASSVDAGAGCAVSEMEKINSNLENEYRNLVSLLKSNFSDGSYSQLVPTLEKSQDAWQEYRNSFCRHIEAQWGGGSGASTGYYECMTELAKERIKYLKAEAEHPLGEN
jgi:uncharacterized protein YecT (DUF1311 family)